MGSSERGEEIDWGSKMRCQPGSSHHASRVQAEIVGWRCPRLRRINTRRAGRIAQKQVGHHTAAPSLLRWSSFQKVAGCAACESHNVIDWTATGVGKWSRLAHRAVNRERRTNLLSCGLLGGGVVGLDGWDGSSIGERALQTIARWVGS